MPATAYDRLKAGPVNNPYMLGREGKN